MPDVIGLAEPTALDRAATALERGGLVVLPTDTVYGVAVLPSVPGASARLFEVKHRPSDAPVAVLVASPDDAWVLAEPTPQGHELARRHWPGALTLVCRRRPAMALELGHDRRTVGVRCPDHGFLQALSGRVGPLATTSANRHGQPTPETAAGVIEQLGDAVDLVIDGGPCEGVASTVVDLSGDGPVVLREGSIDLGELALGD